MTPKQIFRRARRQRRRALTPSESKQILTHYGISVVKAELATDVDQAVRLARRIGWPVVLKVVSPQIIHKTDVGGVELDLRDETDVRRAWERIARTVGERVPTASIEGMLVQQMVEGYEVIVGGKLDPQFGQTVMLGAGGIYAEVLRDVSIRICPVTQRDARQMISEIKFSQVLRGYRGRPPADLEALTDVICRTSRMLEENPEIGELDINPLFVLTQGAVAVDVRIILARSAIQMFG
jgi:acetyl-CoA synthetase (ADP-forming)